MILEFSSSRSGTQHPQEKILLQYFISEEFASVPKAEIDPATDTQ